MNMYSLPKMIVSFMYGIVFLKCSDISDEREVKFFRALLKQFVEAEEIIPV